MIRILLKNVKTGQKFVIDTDKPITCTTDEHIVTVTNDTAAILMPDENFVPEQITFEELSQNG